MNQKKQLKFVISTLLFLVVLAAMVIIYVTARPKSSEEAAGMKSITVLVTIPEKETKEIVIKTDADYLRQALDQEKLIEGKTESFGFYLTTVNKVIADESKQEWWCITKRGEEIFTGIDEIAIQDGDQYEITLTTGY